MDKLQTIKTKKNYRYIYSKDMLKGWIISTAGKLKSAEKCLIRPKIPKAKRSFSEN